jgi:hypothetical protein
VELPLERLTVGIVGGDQGATEAASRRAAAAQFDAEAQHRVDAGGADPDGTAEQGVQGVEVRGERRALGGEPGKNAFVTLVDAAFLLAECQAGNDLFDELALAGGIEGRRNFGVIVHPDRDQRQVAAAAIGRQSGEVGQAGKRIDQPLGARTHHGQPGPDHAEQEKCRRDVERDKVSLGQQRRGENEDCRALHHPLAPAVQGKSCGGRCEHEPGNPAEVDRVALLQCLGGENMDENAASLTPAWNDILVDARRIGADYDRFALNDGAGYAATDDIGSADVWEYCPNPAHNLRRSHGAQGPKCRRSQPRVRAFPCQRRWLRRALSKRRSANCRTLRLPPAARGW